MTFKTKTHLLSELREICDLKDLVQFAKLVAADSLNSAKIKTKGTVEEILESLMKAPKSVLENAFEEKFSDEDQGWEDEDDDESDGENDSSDDLDEEE